MTYIYLYSHFEYNYIFIHRQANVISKYGFLKYMQGHHNYTFMYVVLYKAL